MNGWVFCDEKLPQKNGDYIVTVWMEDGSIDTDVSLFLSDEKEWLPHRSEDVIAWMPFPAPAIEE